MISRASLFALAAICWSAVAMANPDVWVRSKITYIVDGQTVTGIDLEWHFDQYFSAQTIDEFDANKDGRFDQEETQALRSAAFDPLKEHDYHLHLWADDAVKRMALDKFAARIADDRLIYEITLRIVPGVNYRTDTLATSLHDGEIIIDFQFIDGQFLLVKGDFDGACKFRVSRGKGAQAGHPRVITLLCGV